MDYGFDLVGLVLVVRFLWFVGSVWVFLAGGGTLLTAYGLVVVELCWLCMGWGVMLIGLGLY